MPNYIELSADECISTAELIGRCQIPFIVVEPVQTEEKEAEDEWQ